MGRPSPRKKYWVIQIQGAYVRFEGMGIRQLERGPSPFETESQAKSYAGHVYVGELFFVNLVRVDRAWLDSVAKGEITPKVQTYHPERLTTAAGLRGW